MKFLIVLVTLGVAANAALPNNSCSADLRFCTSKFAGSKYTVNELTDVTSQLLDQSFDFLLLSAAFSQYHQNRPGFQKLYRNIADEAWSDAQAVMKYQSKRGNRATMNPSYRYVGSELRALNDPYSATEHQSLKLAVEYQKLVQGVAHSIHKKTSVAHRHPAQYDPDVAHFLDEELIAGQADSVRQLAGYVHTVEGILNGDDATRDMGLHLFDEYLQKA